MAAVFPQHLTGYTVTILKAGKLKDPFSGQTRDDWTNPVEGQTFDTIPVNPGPVQDNSTGGESRPEFSDLSAKAFLPIDADISARDRVRIGPGPYAGTWDVQAVAHWVNHIVGLPFNVELTLQKIKG